MSNNRKALVCRAALADTVIGRDEKSARRLSGDGLSAEPIYDVGQFRVGFDHADYERLQLVVV
jgi:hypothetical protein